MMEQIKIYISLSPEIVEILVDNEVDVYQTLKTNIPEIINVSGEKGIVGEENHTRDISLIILASSASFFIISQGIVSIINALGNNKKIAVVEKTLIPVENSRGEIVNNSDGKPLLQWQEKTRLVESKLKNYNESKIKALSFELTSKNN